MRELVLTGLKEYWPENEENALFLGPWCFAYNHKYKFWDQKKFTLAQSPWKTPKEILEASLYIDSLTDKIMPFLAALMNNFHNTNYSERFWKIYLIVWLHHWLGICYDRYWRLEYLRQTLTEKIPVRILDARDYPTSNFCHFFKEVTEGHYYNFVLMSDIIRFAKFEHLLPKSDSFSYNNTQNSSVGREEGRQLLSKVKDKFMRRKSSIKATLLDHLSSSIYLGNIYGMSLIDRLYLQFSCDPFFFFKNNKRLSKCRGERAIFVQQTLGFNAQNEFEKIVEKILLSYVPDALLTVYLRYGKCKTNVWIGNDIYRSEEYAARIADVCERGGSWISAQHGGAYGCTYSFPLGKIEFDTTDGFISWGWDKDQIYSSKYYPLPSPMLSKLPKHKQTKEQLTFVSTAHPPYFYRLHSKLRPEDLLDFMENNLRFFRKLNEDISSNLKYRPYFNNYGTDELEFMSKELSPSQLLKDEDLISEFQNCKLVVINHMETSFLEAFVMNTPTILYWNTEHFVISTLARHYFEKLRSAGILFDTPDAAAQKVNEIWRNVPAWWQQPEVQKAKKEFCRQFAREDRNWRKEWREFLKTFK